MELASKSKANSAELEPGGDRLPRAPGEAISKQLQRIYADVLAEPVPQGITDLVRQLEKRQREGGNR